MTPTWQIVHEKQFDRELLQLKGTLERGDEFVRGVEWLLSRNPERGDFIREDLWVLAFLDGDSEEAKIAYTFSHSKREVYLLSIRKVDAE